MPAASRSLAVVLSASILAACGQATEPPPVQDTALGDTVATMDKARAVEETTLEHKENIDKALDAAEGNH